MRRLFFVCAVVAAIAATSCEKIIGGDYIKDEPKIAFEEDQMIVSAEGGEVIIPINSTGIDDVFIASDSNWIRDENGDLIPIDEWIEIVKVIDEYDAEEGTRALPMYKSAIVVKVLPNDTGYGRSATLSARSFTVSDRIIIRQPAAEQ